LKGTKIINGEKTVINSQMTIRYIRWAIMDAADNTKESQSLNVNKNKTCVKVYLTKSKKTI
jgi:hypothetical protein